MGSPDWKFGLAVGESQLIFPECADEHQARQQVLHVVRRSPEHFGHRQSRWTLHALRQTIDWLRHLTLVGVSRLLTRLQIHYKRGRLYLHSPDLAYDTKRDSIELKRLRVQYRPQREVFLYLDEFTYYRQPTLAYDYEVAGHVYPLARLSYGTNPYQRVIAALNAYTGQVTYRHGDKIGIEAMANFMDELRQTYPDATTIYIALDNNPLHFHPLVMSRLQPQVCAWKQVLPPTWPTDVTPGSLPIVLLPLPTYASWLNPIEKLWHWLKRDVLHLHRMASDWSVLKARVIAFLDQFLTPSDALLRYVGLLPY